MVTELAIYREVKVRGGPIRGGHSASVNAANFVLNSHMLPYLKKSWKTKISLKTESNHKESTPGEIKKHEQQIADLIWSLSEYIDPFHGAIWNMAADVELRSNITNGPL